jgi:hypothetical protein
MHFATRVRTRRVALLYSEIALSRKQFGIGHMYIYTFLLIMADPVTSLNIDLSYWDTLYRPMSLNYCCKCSSKRPSLRDATSVESSLTSPVGLITFGSSGIVLNCLM